MTGPARNAAPRRFEDYVLASDTPTSEALWQAAGGPNGTTLLICGIGFDPRTLDVPARMDTALGGRLRVLALGLPGEPGSTVGALARSNEAALTALLGDRVTFLPPVAVQDSSTAGPYLTRMLVKEHGLLDAAHVVVDISALPSSVSFPLVRLLLAQSEPGAQQPFTGDLQVCVADSPDIDARIRPTGLDEPATLAGFKRLPDHRRTRVWVPVLGEGRAEQLRAAREFLQPDEVCPVLPFPARRPRRADDLLLEHRQLLFDELVFEPRNVLHASERNPFDLYRQICELADRYGRALAPLGGATVVVTQHASKLLSLGVVLAAHEQDLVVVHVRPTGYDLAEGPDLAPDAGTRPEPVLHTAWLSGQPYGP